MNKTMNNTQYKVIISYSEPLFSRRNGKTPDTIYNSTFIVKASNPNTAIKKARKKFTTLTENSQVSWRREILKCRLKAV